MRWSLVDDNNMVVNIIEYDGKSPVEPPDKLKLIETNDWVKIGESIDTPEPPKPAPMTPADIKNLRNSIYEKDLSAKGVYLLIKKDNPNLTFSDCLDYLEKQSV